MWILAFRAGSEHCRQPHPQRSTFDLRLDSGVGAEQITRFLANRCRPRLLVALFRVAAQTDVLRLD